VIRVLLTVLLAAALAGASLPAIEDARAARATQTAESGAATLQAAAAELVRESDPVPRGAGVSGARVETRVRVPPPTFAGAGLTYLAVGGHPDRSLRTDGPDSDVVVYRIGDRPPRVLALPVDLRAVRDGRLRGDAAPLALRGDARLVLGYARVGGESAVTVARTRIRNRDGDRDQDRVRPSVRNFKSENAASRLHVRA
jgi:hypothetical protein